ncbi:TRP C-terminal domain-containing protein [Plasmodiophora brassicae]
MLLLPCLWWAWMTVDMVAVDAAITFPSAAPGSSLAGLSVYAATVTTFLGPQPGDPNSPRSGRVVLLTDDMCKPIAMQAAGDIILATAEATLGACSLETKYLTLYATGAAGVIAPVLDVVPSLNMYSNDGTKGAQTRGLPMLFLRIGPSRDFYDVLIAGAPGQNATITPDVNVWEATFASWYYQLFIRILPSLVMVASGVTAAAYLALHLRITHDEYKSVVPNVSRTSRRLASFVRKSLGLPHAVLTIEVLTSTLPGVVLAIGGYYSTPNLPFPILEYFLSQLSGWSFASSLLSASVWIRQLSRIFDSNGLLTRILRGDYPVVFGLLIVVPIVIDTAFSVLQAIFYMDPLVAKILSATIFVLQLTVGLHVLFGVLRYYWTVRNVQGQTSGSEHGASMDPILQRLGRCALGMSLSMLMICTGTAMMAASSRFMYTPSGWTTCFSLNFVGRALDSAFRVAMFRPRAIKPQGRSWVSTVVAPKSAKAGSQQQQQQQQ